MSGSALPDLDEYDLHRTVSDAELDGVVVPGLSAHYYRRADGDRIASVGRYHADGRDLLMAWGYVDETHCRHSAVRREDGSGWHEVTAGCPDVRLDRSGGDHGDVVGLSLRTPDGVWINATGRSAVP